MPDKQCKGYTRLEKVKLAFKSPWSRAGDESINEPATKNLLGGRPFGRSTSISSEPGFQTRASSMSTTPADWTRFHSSLTVSETTNEPLPPIPQSISYSQLLTADQNRSPPTRQPKPKLGRKGNKENVRPVISAPTLLSPPPKIRTRPIISAPIAQNPSIPQTGMLPDDDGARPQGITTTQFSTADAEALAQKIDKLTELSRASQAGKNLQGVENANMEKPLRLSPLQRSKAILAKATRALAFRTNGNNSNGVGKQAAPDRKEETSSSCSPSTVGSKDNGHVITLVDMHKNEGLNLANDKVKAFMGNGYIKRKPVPGTVKPRAPTPEPDPEADAEADRQLAGAMALGTEDFSGFNFDFAPNGAQQGSNNGSSSVQRYSMSMKFDAGNGQAESQLRFNSSNRHSYLVEPAQTDSYQSNPPQFSTPPVGSLASSEYSDSLSGLAQHPDIKTFAADPFDSSTLGAPLESTHSPSKLKRSKAVRIRKSSTVSTDFENEVDDDAPFVGTHSGPNTVRSTSIKRKSAMVGLRSNRDTMKRAKRDSVTSDCLKEDEAELVTGIGQMDTEERQALLPKDKNLEIKPHEKASINAEGVPKRGSAMFDIGKGKERMRSDEEGKPRLPPRRAVVHNRSAIPRPTARLYSSGMRVRGAYDTER